MLGVLRISKDARDMHLWEATGLVTRFTCVHSTLACVTCSVMYLLSCNHELVPSQLQTPDIEPWFSQVSKLHPLVLSSLVDVALV